MVVRAGTGTRGRVSRMMDPRRRGYRGGRDLRPGRRARLVPTPGPRPLPHAAPPRGRPRARSRTHVCGLGCILGDDPAEVVVGLECAHSQLECLDELPKVRKPAQALEIVRQRVVVSLRDLPQRLRAHRPLQVYVQLDLRYGYGVTSATVAVARNADSSVPRNGSATDEFPAAHASKGREWSGDRSNDREG
jgi:hypothetical protein